MNSLATIRELTLSSEVGLPLFDLLCLSHTAVKLSCKLIAISAINGNMDQPPVNCKRSDISWSMLQYALRL